MNRLNPEGHDESQYLPKDTPPVNPFRMQHGKLRWEGKSIKASEWLPDILYEETLLTSSHLDTCKIIQRAILSVQAVLGISDLRGFIGSTTILGPLGTQGCIFHAVMRNLRPSRANLCLWVAWEPYNRGNLPLARHLIIDIKESLDLAEKVIEEVRDK